MILFEFLYLYVEDAIAFLMDIIEWFFFLPMEILEFFARAFDELAPYIKNYRDNLLIISEAGLFNFYDDEI